MESGAATVAVPAHITGFFSAHPDPDPLVAGSRGAGVTLADAITVSVEPATETHVIVDEREADIPAVDHVLAELGVTARIDVSVDVPMGSGFGVSGAIALGTAFAANRLAEGERTANELVGLAHAGDVIAGTGLGDVVAQYRGGVPIRLDPGGPGHGAMDGIGEARTVEWISRGELSTEAVLAGDTAAINRAGEAALDRLLAEPTLDRFMAESRRFANETELLPSTLESIIDEVEAVGGQASMAMLGHTAFALGDDLSRAGYEPTRHEMAPSGVRFVEPETED